MIDKIKIPQTLKVGGRSLLVKFTKNLLRDTGNRGEVEWHTETMRIDSDMVYTLTVITFLHEIVHCIDEVYCNRNLSEDETNQLAEGLYQVFDGMGIKFKWEGKND